jgi:putative methanogen marker protein 4
MGEIMKYLIGIGKYNREEILKAYNKLLDEGIDVELMDNPKELIYNVVNNKVGGAIRGTLSSSEVIPYLKKEIGKFYRASILKNPFTGGIFLLAPVGIDEIGDDGFKDKIDIINYSVNFLKGKDIMPKIGLLSAGRLSDYGRSKKIDESIDECESIIEYFKNYNNHNYNGIYIEHKGILIEEYLKEGYNIIVAPDGISGNLIFRCLGLVCGIEGYGAVILNKSNIKFIDTSRSGTWKRYYNAVKFLTYND